MLKGPNVKKRAQELIVSPNTIISMTQHKIILIQITRLLLHVFVVFNQALLHSISYEYILNFKGTIFFGSSSKTFRI